MSLSPTGAPFSQSEDENAIVQIRFGHEALRLLALASDGQGPWAGIYDILKIKDDVLRVMGGCVDVLSIAV